MAVALAETPAPASRTGRKRAVKQAYEQVSDRLGNTPAVCKASYVDPRVVDRFESGETIAEAVTEAAGAPDDRTFQRVLEQAVCQMLTS
jgi:DNA topoisomerase IB